MYANRNKILIKTISILVLITFIFTNTSYAAPSSRSLFRNKKVDHRKLSTQQEDRLNKKRSIFKGEDAREIERHRKEARTVLTSHLEDLTQIHIPSELGRVIEVYKAPKDQSPLIVHIQDLHTNPEAELNLASILEILIKDYNLDLVCSEGAEGEVDTSSVSSFPDYEIREKTARLFINSGELTGEEYLSITKYPDLPIWGIEDKDIYFKNIIEFNKIIKFSPDAQVFISQVQKVLKELKTKIYSKELQAIDQKELDYEDEKIETDGYLKYLTSYTRRFNIPTDNYKNITLLREAVEQESKIDQGKIMQESQGLLLNLQAAISGKSLRKDMDSLMVKAQLFKEQKISPFSFYSYLKDLALKHLPEEITEYPHLTEFIDYLTKVNSLDSTKLFTEMEDLMYEVKKQLAKTEEEKIFIKALRNIKFLEGFFNLKVSNEELDYYLQNKDSHKVGFFESFLNPTLKKYNISTFIDYNPNLIDARLQELEDFYKTVKRRDVAMVRNAVSEIEKRNAKVSALVSGGFHTKGITKLLREKDYSYIVVSPYSSTDIDEENYHFLLSGKRKPITELLEGLDNTLRSPLMMASEAEDDTQRFLVGMVFQAAAIFGKTGGEDKDLEDYLLKELPPEFYEQLTSDLIVRVEAHTITIYHSRIGKELMTGRGGPVVELTGSMETFVLKAAAEKAPAKAKDSLIGSLIDPAKTNVTIEIIIGMVLNIRSRIGQPQNDERLFDELGSYVDSIRFFRSEREFRRILIETLDKLLMDPEIQKNEVISQFINSLMREAKKPLIIDYSDKMCVTDLPDDAIEGKVVLVSADLNVGNTSIELKPAALTRIKGILGDVEYVSDRDSDKLVIMSHNGARKDYREGLEDGEVDPDYSLEPVADKLTELLGKEVLFAKDCIGDETKRQIQEAKPGSIILLEQTRFYAAETSKEESEVEGFARQIQDTVQGDVFVNVAAGALHRGKQASKGVVSKFIKGPKVIGLLVKKELDILYILSTKPKRKVVAIMGGAKIEGKIDVMKRYAGGFVDKIVIVGKMALPFINREEIAGEIIKIAKRNNVELILPEKVIAAQVPKATKAKDFIKLLKKGTPQGLVTRLYDITKVPEDFVMLDVDPDDIERELIPSLKDANTVIDNGTAGLNENPNFELGTNRIIDVLRRFKAGKPKAKLYGLGGDGVKAILSRLDQREAEKIFEILSTMGGAALEYSSGKELSAMKYIDSLSSKTKMAVVDSNVHSLIKKDKATGSTIKADPKKHTEEILFEATPIIGLDNIYYQLKRKGREQQAENLKDVIKIAFQHYSELEDLLRGKKLKIKIVRNSKYNIAEFDPKNNTLVIDELLLDNFELLRQELVSEEFHHILHVELLRKLGNKKPTLREELVEEFLTDLKKFEDILRIKTAKGKATLLKPLIKSTDKHDFYKLLIRVIPEGKERNDVLNILFEEDLITVSEQEALEKLTSFSRDREVQVSSLNMHYQSFFILRKELEELLKQQSVTIEEIDKYALEFNKLRVRYSSEVAETPYIYLGGICINPGRLFKDNVNKRSFSKDYQEVVLVDINNKRHLKIGRVELDGTLYLKIGQRTYKVDTSKIVNLSNILLQEDLLLWLGNHDLIGFSNKSIDEILGLPNKTRENNSGLTLHLYDHLKDPISITSEPELVSYPPHQADIKLRRRVLRDVKLNADNRVSLMRRLNSISIVAQSNSSIKNISYKEAIEDRILVTNKLEEIIRTVKDTEIQRIAREILFSISLLVIKETPKGSERNTFETSLTSDEEKKIKKKTPFEITSAETSKEEFKRLNDIFAKVVSEGKIKPYFIINIRNFSPDTFLAYSDFLRNISKKYNGNITFLLSIESYFVEIPGEENPYIPFLHDMPGAYVSRRRVIDAFGRDFYLKEHIANITDGGEKTRAANVGVCHEQWSKTLTGDGISFLETNILTAGSMWFLLPQHGEGIRLWLASDGSIQFGKINVGGKALSELPWNFQIAACGSEALVMTADQRKELKELIEQHGYWTKELEQNTRFQSLWAQIRTNITRRKLEDRGIFVTDETGKMVRFLEKRPAEEIAETAINNPASDGSGRVIENIFFLIERAEVSYNLVTELSKIPTYDRDGFLARRPVSVFRTIFQGFLSKDDSPAKDVIEHNIHRIHGISYGEGSLTGDIADLEQHFSMWEGYLRAYRGSKKDNVRVSEDVTIEYRGDPEELHYLLRDVKIEGKGVLEIGEGVLIQGGSVKLAGKLVIPNRTKIIDCNLEGVNIRFHGEAGVIMGADYYGSAIGQLLDVATNKTGSLHIYGDETLVQIDYKDGKSYLVRMINSLPYKGKKISELIGGHSKWDKIRAKMSISESKFEKVIDMPLSSICKSDWDWLKLAGLVFSEDIPDEILYRVRDDIINIYNETMEPRHKIEAIADLIYSIPSARLTITNRGQLLRDAEDILSLFEKDLEEDILNKIRDSYHARFNNQIEGVVKDVSYDNVRDLTYGEALYKVLVAIHPRLLDIEGISTWDEVKDIEFINLKNYGGLRTARQAKSEIDALRMQNRIMKARSGHDDITIADVGIRAADHERVVNLDIRNLIDRGHEIVQIEGLEEFEVHLIGNEKDMYIDEDTGQRAHAGGISSVGSSNEVRRLWIAKGFYNKNRARALTYLYHEAVELILWWKKTKELLRANKIRAPGKTRSKLPTIRQWISRNIIEALRLQELHHKKAQSEYPVEGEHHEKRTFVLVSDRVSVGRDPIMYTTKQPLVSVDDLENPDLKVRNDVFLLLHEEGLLIPELELIKLVADLRYAEGKSQGQAKKLLIDFINKEEMFVDREATEDLQGVVEYVEELVSRADTPYKIKAAVECLGVMHAYQSLVSLWERAPELYREGTKEFYSIRQGIPDLLRQIGIVSHGVISVLDKAIRYPVERDIRNNALRALSELGYLDARRVLIKLVADLEHATNDVEPGQDPMHLQQQAARALINFIKKMDVTRPSLRKLMPKLERNVNKLKTVELGYKEKRTLMALYRLVERFKEDKRKYLVTEDEEIVEISKSQDRGKGSVLHALSPLANFLKIKSLTEEERNLYVRRGRISIDTFRKLRSGWLDDVIFRELRDFIKLGMVKRLRQGMYKIKVRLTEEEIKSLPSEVKEILNIGSIIKGGISEEELKKVKYEIGKAAIKAIPSERKEFMIFNMNLKKKKITLDDYIKTFSIQEPDYPKAIIEFNNLVYYVNQIKDVIYDDEVLSLDRAMLKIAAWGSLGNAIIPFEFGGKRGFKIDEGFVKRVSEGDIIVRSRGFKTGEWILRAEVTDKVEKDVMRLIIKLEEIEKGEDGRLINDAEAERLLSLIPEGVKLEGPIEAFLRISEKGRSFRFQGTAIRALGKMAVEEAIPLFLKLWPEAKKNSTIQEAIVEAFGDIGITNKEVISALKEGLSHPGIVREKSLESLKKLNSLTKEHEVIKLTADLNYYVGHPDDPSLLVIIDTLLGKITPGERLKGAIPDLIALANNTYQTPLIRATAIQALGKMRARKVVTDLLKLWENREQLYYTVRGAIVEALGEIGARSPRVVLAIKEGLEDIDIDVREKSLESLKKLNSLKQKYIEIKLATDSYYEATKIAEERVIELITNLEHAKGNSEALVITNKLINNIPKGQTLERVVPHLLKLVKDTERPFFVQRGAIQALSKMGEKTALIELWGERGSFSDEARLYILNGFAGIDIVHEDIISVVTWGLRDSYGPVREASLEFLERYGRLNREHQVIKLIGDLLEYGAHDKTRKLITEELLSKITPGEKLENVLLDLKILSKNTKRSTALRIIAMQALIKMGEVEVEGIIELLEETKEDFDILSSDILMKDLTVTETKELAEWRAAGRIANLIRKKQGEKVVISLATGGTYEGIYEKLMQLTLVDKGISWENVVIFALDEYVWNAYGYSQRYRSKYYDKESYRSYLHNNILDWMIEHAGLKKENIHLMNGLTNNPKSETELYEDLINRETNGEGVDLQLLDVRIALNEAAPGMPLHEFLKLKTRVVRLEESTIKAKRRFFDDNEYAVPPCAMSQGISTILNAKEIMLVATGGKEAPAIKKTLTEEATSSVPASVLQLHPKVNVIIDKDAARELIDSTQIRQALLAESMEEAGASFDDGRYIMDLEIPGDILTDLLTTRKAISVCN